MTKQFLLISLLMLSSNLMAQTENPLDKILASSDSLIREVVDHSEKYELQIIYTQIDRNAKNIPQFTDYKFNVEAKNYFYPASTVKMPVAFLALEKINKLRKNGYKVSANSEIRIESDKEWQSPVLGDSTSQNGKASIEHYIKKIFLVSDNDAFNRLFEFLGSDYINESLENKNISPLRISHRLSVSGVDNKITPPIQMFNKTKKVYSQEEQIAKSTYPDLMLNKTMKGKAYYSGNELINKPMDFSSKNYYPLESMLKTIQRVIFPEAFPLNERFDLTKSDYKFLYKYMSMYPSMCDYPTYDLVEYYDSYVKFLGFGDNKNPMPHNIKIFNKVGDAYGYMIDCAYIIDTDTKAEFFLTAVIHVNENQTYNDNTYEYNEIGFPFMAKLGKAVLNYEKTRKREFLPDLKKFE